MESVSANPKDDPVNGAEEAVQWQRSGENLTIPLPKSLPESLVTGFGLC